jgi:hypothetical protein
VEVKGETSISIILLVDVEVGGTPPNICVSIPPRKDAPKITTLEAPRFWNPYDSKLDVFLFSLLHR